jgi:hypothetical protein
VSKYGYQHGCPLSNHLFISCFIPVDYVIFLLTKGGIICASCPHGIVYAIKPVLRSESVRDHLDILLSLKLFPVVVVSDMASMLAAHAENRKPGIFKPFKGRLLRPTAANLAAAKERKLQCPIQGLDDSEVTDDTQRYSLADKFHQGNLSAEADLLRRVEHVPKLAGRLNTQVQEQLFRKVGRDAYFLTQMSPAHYLFIQRLIIHLHNETINNKRVAGIEKTIRESSLPGMVHRSSGVVVVPKVWYTKAPAMYIVIA